MEEENNNLRSDDHHHDGDHVPQRSRRDKLRIHDNMEMNSDEQLIRNARCYYSFYEPVVLSSSSMARPMSNSSSSLAGVNHLVCGGGSMDHHPIPSPNNWRSCDWMVSGWLGGSDQNHPLSTTIINATTSASSGSMHYHNNSPNYNMHESPSRVSTDHDHNMNFTSPGFQSSLQDVVTIASSGGSRPAGDIGNQLFHDNSSGWRPHRPVPDYPHQHEELGSVSSDWRTRGLSLTLSSNPPFQLGQGFVSGDIDQIPKDRQDFINSGSTCTVMPNPIISRGSSGKSVKDIRSAATLTHPSAGPLGPFTGYATILKSSKFLKPAQRLLDEFCSVPGSEVFRTTEVPERLSGKVNMFAEAFNASDHQALVRNNGGGGGSAASSSTLYSSNNRGAGECAVKDRPRESCQPEYQQKKAKLAYMHEEVCRRYNQYHQQIQMVVSSFESVAGLGDATPYISLALKTISRHFRSLRNVISDQLWHIRKALGEGLMFPTAGSNKGDTCALRQKYKEQSFQKHKSGGDNVGFYDPQQQVWRPQRGLPERSVAILRTWLFEHFLHPYPTDTDKHMLAAQTGLSRNQVSNWFINARVRVWKPMVEEIHMLETNSLAQAANKSEENFVGEGSSCEETANKVGMEFPGIGSSTDIDCEQWSREKRSRVECQIPQSIERSSFMGFMPYQRGGLGAVSLTLGLCRHTAENAQQQQIKQQEDQLQRQFGGHMFHDFVG